MTSVSTISWIFMATAVASQNDPTNIDSISSAADAINHAVPTPEELHTSLTWLQSRHLIIIRDERISLTVEGLALYTMASKKTKVWMKTWTNLEKLLKDK